MRVIFLLLALSGAAWPQALTEGAAAVAGGAAGGVAGKKIGEGVGGILNKVAASAATAADGKDGKQDKAAPALEVGPGVPKTTPKPEGPKPDAPKAAPKATSQAAPPPKTYRSLFPPPPPPAPAVKGKAKVEPPSPPEEVVEAVAPASPATQSATPQLVVEAIALPLPDALPPTLLPPPPVTPEDLKTLSKGMGRLAVLKLGSPASRVTMMDGDHLLEIYSYANRDKSFGRVRLSDGVVSSIEIRP